MTLTDAVVQQLCLLHQINLIEAAVLTVGLCQPDVTGLLLPFHSDDVIVWTFYPIDSFHSNSHHRSSLIISLIYFSTLYSLISHWLFHDSILLIFFAFMWFFLSKNSKMMIKKQNNFFQLMMQKYSLINTLFHCIFLSLFIR